MQSLFTRFFPDEAAPWLFSSPSEYIDGRGEFYLMADLIKSAESTHEVGDCHRHIYHATYHSRVETIFEFVVALRFIQRPLFVHRLLDHCDG